MPEPTHLTFHILALFLQWQPAEKETSWSYKWFKREFWKNLFHIDLVYIYWYLWQDWWRRQWQPTPVLLPGKSHGRRSLAGCSPWGHKESDTTESPHIPFSLSCIGEGNGNPLQCSCLENPRDGAAWWASLYGVAQGRTRLKWRSSSSSSITGLGFPGGSAGKESSHNEGDLGLIPGLGRSPGQGNSYPLQYPGLENSRDCIVHGVAVLDMTEGLSLSFPPMTGLKDMRHGSHVKLSIKEFTKDNHKLLSSLRLFTSLTFKSLHVLFPCECIVHYPSLVYLINYTGIQIIVNI